jgi:tRNA G18 (ribose-2'-O)-methylase SpoU
MDFTQKKFLSLSPKGQHKKAGELLADLFSKKTKSLSTYRKMEDWLSLPSINLNEHEEVSCRYHLHLEKASLCKREHSLLHIKKEDSPSNTPFLPIHIYLCSLRSAFNVGSILRTTEAFRLGTIHFCPKTPTTDNPKVQKASMGTYSLVPCESSDLSTLPKPWIALETATPSTSPHSYDFPEVFTLILGNEEFGVPKEILRQCDVILEIPLQGSKNSLNVASAFSIVASCIRKGLS